ncbi:cyclin-dependent kinase 20 [Drosophila navojoa]|uniref:cyclin-dependent kinase 20 n=1 Tax=Drosophila navojoa TaxID=7232 RepID=UPI0008479687|nr:cyclin-dependent kinase 20 [Drosophila navojoa]
MEDYAPSRYKMQDKIGEGVHGCVFKALDLQRNVEVAIKKVALKNKFGNISLNTLREIKTLQLCNSEYILNIIEIYPDLTGLSLVLEYMPDTLYGRLKSEVNPLSRQQVRKYSLMMFKGMAYLHEAGIMHRDIKPANLLISHMDVLKIADFGLARLYFPDEESRLYSPQVSTRWYRAPEILWGSQKYGPAVDLWACGNVLAEMLRGVPLFAGTTDIEQLAIIIRTLGSPRLNEWPELTSLPDYSKIRFPNSVGIHWNNLFPSCTHAVEIDLVSNLVVYNPKNRLKATEVGPYIITNGRHTKIFVSIYIYFAGRRT